MAQFVAPGPYWRSTPGPGVVSSDAPASCQRMALQVVAKGPCIYWRTALSGEPCSDSTGD